MKKYVNLIRNFLILPIIVTALLIPGRALTDSPSFKNNFQSFAGIHWGETSPKIIEKWGQPDSSVSRGRFTRKHVYNTLRDLSPRSSLYFLVHDTQGLKKGGYRITISEQSSCVEDFKKLKNKYNRLYSSYPYREVKNDSSIPRSGFCGDLRRGKAYWKISWADTAGHFRLSLSLPPGSGTIHVDKQSTWSIRSHNKPTPKDRNPCRKLSNVKTVKALQQRLKAMGANIRTDGLWGPNTAKSLLKFCPDGTLSVELANSFW